MNLSEHLGVFLRRNVNWLIALGLAILLLQDIFGTHGVLAMRRSQKQATEMQEEIQRLDSENRQLQDRVRVLKSDPAAIERIAREEMGLARPGELIFELPLKAGDRAKQQTQATQSEKKP